MAEKKQLRKVRVKRKDHLGFNWFFWISLIIIIIPCVYFVNLLLSARDVTNVPILGDRVANTIAYQINNNDVDAIRNEVKSIPNIESCEVNLIVETLRITVDAVDGLSDEKYQEVVKSVYDVVDAHLPISQYFTKVDDFKQYDLEVNLYDNLELADPTIIALYKNGAMDQYTIQVLSQPINEELADRLLHPKTEQDNTDEEDDGIDEEDTENVNE